MVENIVGKGENAGYQHFLLFLQYFHFFSGSLEMGIVWQRVGIENSGEPDRIFSLEWLMNKNKTFTRDKYLSHNNPCFQCNTAITNFLVSNTCEIRFHEFIGQSTVPMYSYAKYLKHG